MCSCCFARRQNVDARKKTIFFLLFFSSPVEWLDSEIWWNNWNPGTSMAEQRRKEMCLCVCARCVYFSIWLWRRSCVCALWIVTLTEQLNWITLFGSLNLITSWEVSAYCHPIISFRTWKSKSLSGKCNVRDGASVLGDTVDMVVSYAFRIDIVHVLCRIQWISCIRSSPVCVCVCVCEAIHMQHDKCNGMCPIDDCFSDISCFLHSIFIIRLSTVRPSQFRIAICRAHTHTHRHSPRMCLHAREWANSQRNR